MSEPPVKPSHQVLFIGKNGSGKSIAARYVAAHVRSRMVVVNVKNDPDLTRFVRSWWGEDLVERVKGSPDQVGRALDRGKVQVVEYVMGDPADVDEADRLYGQLVHRRELTTWLDEAYGPTTSARLPRNMGVYLQHGRARNLRHLACTQRPVRIAKPLMTEAHHVVFFPRGFAASDKRVVADEMGLSVPELEHLAGALRKREAEFGRYAHLWLDRDGNHLHRRPDVPMVE